MYPLGDSTRRSRRVSAVEYVVSQPAEELEIYQNLRDAALPTQVAPVGYQFGNRKFSVMYVHTEGVFSPT